MLHRALREDIPDLLSIVVPRHPERFSRVAALASRSFNVQKHSEARAVAANTQVLIGDSMGEMALVDHEPRSATVRAVEDATLIVLTRKGIEQLRKRSPHAVSLVMENIARLLCTHLRRTSSQLAQFKLPVG